MDISVYGKLCGVVAAPPSKSQSHRLLIASFLCRQPVTVANITYSQDILATIDCCKSLGGDIECKENSVIFNGFFQSNHAYLNCRESGSTLRFMLPIAAALGITSSFSGDGRLPQRPIDEMLTVLTSKGVTSTATALPLTLSGTMSGGDYHINPSQSSQYLTGLLYALPLLCEDSKIYLTNEIQSKPYIDMTLQVLEQFGIKITETSYGYFIKGNQRYIPTDTTVEGDWSNVAFWLCAGAVGNKICCKGLNINSTQGDKAIVNLLQQFGCNISAVNGAVTVSGENLNGISIDATHIPDAVPALAVVAACSLGKTTIYNAQRLRIKESDRIKSVVNNLNAIGGTAQETDDGMVITGKPMLNGGIVDCCNDHRIAMAFSIASLRCKLPVTLLGADCVNKSYPHFFEDFKMLGGNADVINVG